MKRSLLVALALLVVSACASDTDAPPQSAPMRGGGGMGRARLAAATVGLELLPPADWWHDDEIARQVALTGDQVAQLDKISSGESDEIARLERDGMVALRDLRNALELAQPTNDDLSSAGRRVREIRGSLLDRQMQMLADERLVLTQKQWSALQAALQDRRRENRDRGASPGRGGRGRGGFGGGRRPFPG